MKTLPQDFYLGEWHVRPQLNRIEEEGKTHQVEPRVMRVLVRLAESQGEVVTRDALLDAVWGETIVTEDSLTRTIFDLRKVFKDKAQNPKVIETIRKVGYRLLLPVSYATGGDSVSVDDIVVTPNLALPKPPVAHQRTKSHPSLYVAIGVLIIAIAAVFIWNMGEHSPGLQHVPLTTFKGAEVSPALSPDGKQVAFVWNDGTENLDLYVKQVGTENPARLTDHPGLDASPAWSPDGRQLAFMRTAAGTCGVFVMPVPGSGERQVATCQTNLQMPRSVAWAPDGSHVLFVDRVDEESPFQLFVVSLKTLAVTTLTKPQQGTFGDVSPAFAPDGSQVAYVRALSASTVVAGLAPVLGDVYIASVSVNDQGFTLLNERRLSEDVHSLLGLDWSQDGQSIVYSTNRGTMNYSLWRLAATGGAPEMVHRHPYLLRNPSVARQDSRMAYEIWQATTNIWQLRFDPNTEKGWDREPLIQSTRWDFAPHISPDGSQIAFVSTRTSWAELWVSDSNGENFQQLTDLKSVTLDMPRWSPQSDRIAFIYNSDVYVIQAHGGEPLQLTSGDAEDAAPGWSMDGKWVYFGSNRSGQWQVWRVPVQGGTAEQVTWGGGYVAMEVQRDTSAWLIYSGLDHPGLYARSLTGGEEHTISTSMQANHWNQWSVKDGHVYFVDMDNGAMLKSWALDTGQYDTVFDFSKDEYEGFTNLQALPTGETFLYTRLEQISGDLMLAENFQ